MFREPSSFSSFSSRDSTQTHVDSVPIFRLRINEVLLRRLQHSRCAVLCASLMGHKSGILFLLLFRYRHSSESLPIFKDFPCSLSLAGAATSIIFVTTKVLLWQNTFRCNKSMLITTSILLSGQTYVCHDKMCLLSQRLLLQQQYACHNKTSCDKRVMSQQISVTTKFCCNNFGGMWWGAMCYTFHISTIFHIKPHFQHSKPYHISHHSTSNHISHIKSCQTIHVFHCNKSMLSWQTEVCRNKTTSILLSQQT